MPVRSLIHCGTGRFCFCALASFCLVRKDLWLCSDGRCIGQRSVHDVACVLHVTRRPFRPAGSQRAQVHREQRNLAPNCFESLGYMRAGFLAGSAYGRDQGEQRARAYRHRDGFGRVESSRLKVTIFVELRRRGFLTRTRGRKTLVASAGKAQKTCAAEMCG